MGTIRRALLLAAIAFIGYAARVLQMIMDISLDPGRPRKIDRRLAGRARPWMAEAGRLVAGKVADARAHAERALTARAASAEDGRPTARILAKSPSHRAALDRLDEARDALTGGDVRSYGGLVRDARAAFYADSVGLWTPHIPEEFRAAKDPAPTQAGERVARSMHLHGYDVHSEIAPAFEAAKRQLTALLNVASRRNADPEHGPRMLRAWAVSTTRTLTAKAFSAIADGSVGVHHFTGLAMIHPDVRPG